MQIEQIEKFLKYARIEYEVIRINQNNDKIEGFCPLNELRDNCITWTREKSYLKKEEFEKCKGVWVVCSKFDEFFNYNIGGYIFVQDPFSVFFSILDYCYDENKKRKSFIGNSSVVKTKKIGSNVVIGEHCTIDENVIIGDNVEIRNNVSITGNVQIGKDTTIFSGVKIGEEGYGYFTNVFGERKRVKHIGGVVIGSNCQIGENVVIARGCLGNTIIGDSVRIDSLSHIAHNVHIEDDAYVVCLVSLAGSSHVGRNAWIAPCASVANQASVGQNTILGLGAIVLKDIPDNAVVVGNPARIIRERNIGEEI